MNAAIRKKLFYALVIMFGAITLWRLAATYRNNPMIDFICFVDCAIATFSRLDCYNTTNLKLYPWTDPLIVYPGMLIYFIPFSWLPLDAARLIYYFISVVATFGLCWYGFRVTGVERQANFQHPNLKTAMYFAGFFIFVNSSPVLTSLRHGQSTVWICWGILLLLTMRSKWKVVIFGLSALMKYSMFTVFGPLLFAKKYYALCLAGFAVFVLVSLYPAALGTNPIALYTRYFGVLMQETGSGFNSFAVSGYNMLQLEFSRLDLLNTIGKSFCGVLILYVMFRERNSRKIGLNLLLLIFCLTMLISYHRLYDLSIIMLILVVDLSIFLRLQAWRRLLLCGIFCLFFLLPFSMVLKASDLLGHILPLGHVLICRYGEFARLAPLPALAMILLTVFASSLYFHGKEARSFTLNHPDDGDDQY